MNEISPHPKNDNLNKQLQIWYKQKKEIEKLLKENEYILNKIKIKESQHKELEQQIINELKEKNYLHRHIMINNETYHIQSRKQYESMTKTNLYSLLYKFYRQDKKETDKCF